ncbi:MAG: DUF4446 family protein [Clostridia bacterium]|nr:DUF4446 family protein [Clostridia bacterium]
MEVLIKSLTQYTEYWLLGFTGMMVVLLVIFLITIWQFSKVTKRYRTLMRGSEGKNLEELLFAYAQDVRSAVERTNRVEDRCQYLDKVAVQSIQQVGVVRFNAYDNTGSDLSFAVALLDQKGDGVVISSLYGREESRTYAKPIKQGHATYALTDEELEAITKARAARV